jgi:hypothetical protein
MGRDSNGAIVSDIIGTVDASRDLKSIESNP